MIASKPILHQILPFDVAYGATFTYKWDGIQPYYNEVTIYNYTTKKIVYRCMQTTMARKHVLYTGQETDGQYEQSVFLKDEFINGIRYCAYIKIFDRSKNFIAQSDDAVFYCFKTPNFYFDENSFYSVRNYSTPSGESERIGRIIANSAFLNVNYEQENGEVIQEYYFSLYDSAGNLLQKFNTKYSPTTVVNTDNSIKSILSCSIGGVENTDKLASGEINYNSAYLIKCFASTAHGMEITTKIKFVVQKDMGGVGALINVTKEPNNVLTISSNFKIVNANINGEEKYIYDVNNRPFAIDLSDNQKVTYFDGFVFTEPWSTTAIGTRFKENSEILRYANNNGDYFSVKYCVNRYSLVQKAYFLFESIYKNTHYILRSDYLPIEERWYAIVIQYKDNYYRFDVCDPSEIGYVIPEERRG